MQEISTKKIIKNLIGNTVIATLISIISTFIQAKYLPPEDAGYLRSFTIIASYFSILILCPIDSYQRKYSILTGSGNTRKAEKINEAIKYWSVSISIASFIMICIFTMQAIFIHDFRKSLALITLSFLMISMFYSNYTSAYLRCKNKFSSISTINTKSALITLAVSPLIIIYPYAGMILKTIIGPTYTTYKLHLETLKSSKFTLKIDNKRILLLKIKTLISIIKSGLPIFFANYGATALWSLTEASFVIAISSDHKTIGLYTFCATLIEMTSRIPNIITSFYHPKIIELYGRDKSINSIIQYSKSPTANSALVSGVLVFFLYMFSEIIISLLFPNYSEAALMIKISSISILLLSLEMPYSVLIACNRIASQNFIIYSSLLLFVTLSIFCTRLGLNATAILYSSMIAKSLRTFFIYITLYKLRTR